VEIQNHPEIAEALNKNYSYICTEILARDFRIVDQITAEEKEAIELTDTISTFLTVRKVD